MSSKNNSGHGVRPSKDDLILVAGAGGFIGGALVRYFWERGFCRVRAVDKKPLQEWYQRIEGAECLKLDLSQEENCQTACEDVVEVYHLAADMGGMASSRSSSWVAFSATSLGIFDSSIFSLSWSISLPLSSLRPSSFWIAFIFSFK